MVRVVFVHPDLGIGGAERAIIDAALALKSRGHEVKILTAHHDVNHCFEETRDGSLSVLVVGDWLPRSFWGRFYALFAYLRMICIACYLVFFSGLSPDLIFCDQISACIPVLKLMKKSKVLFYCHFPDFLLTDRKTLLKKLYRVPIDWLEEKTTGMSDVVLVNSNFTASVFKRTFTSLRHIDPQVLYPIPDLSMYDNFLVESSTLPSKMDARISFLSINRYERKKNLSLAVHSLSALRKKLNGNLDNIQLVIAGGYDERVSENKEHYEELVNLVSQLNLKDHVSFYKSISSQMKLELLRVSTCLLYTPSNEHFGIVPIEAMYFGLPVIAVNNGGPKETVLDGKTGYLCEQDPDEFADKMLKFVKNPNLNYELGIAGKERVMKYFSFNAFTEKLDKIVHDMLQI
ncbi:hypothetical protein HELRODRAFT_110729 [Helobdella robusta]|uniref:Alpha-1,3/1,6-mannosyltransferase ALG2 n=1 Tax=Helobdella robusta TaxID=6412 RepID=T1EF46_HELRO|nr:hypothetical protein HELRODRAFT_110729 [Helobdella robusta]ESO07213.1 hypothetical protein HELRODRAFT_110729 [Helobdella robusta]